MKQAQESLSSEDQGCAEEMSLRLRNCPSQNTHATWGINTNRDGVGEIIAYMMLQDAFMSDSALMQELFNPVVFKEFGQSQKLCSCTDVELLPVVMFTFKMYLSVCV